jgi:hypothetical protein
LTHKKTWTLLQVKASMGKGRGLPKTQGLPPAMHYLPLGLCPHYYQLSLSGSLLIELGSLSHFVTTVDPKYFNERSHITKYGLIGHMTLPHCIICAYLSQLIFSGFSLIFS